MKMLLEVVLWAVSLCLAALLISAILCFNSDICQPRAGCLLCRFRRLTGIYRRKSHDAT